MIKLLLSRITTARTHCNKLRAVSEDGTTSVYSQACSKCSVLCKVSPPRELQAETQGTVPAIIPKDHRTQQHALQDERTHVRAVIRASDVGREPIIPVVYAVSHEVVGNSKELRTHSHSTTHTCHRHRHK